MQIREPMIFQSARVDRLAFTPAEEVVAVLGLTVPLTAAHARTLGIEWAMNESVAKEGIDDVRLSIELDATDFRFPGLPALKPSLVHRLKLRRTKESGFELAFLIHVPKFYAAEVLEFFLATNKDTFGLTINSLQGELFEGGKRVELSGKDAAAGKEEPEEFAQDDNAARQTLVTHRGNGKGHALPFETAASAMQAAKRSKRGTAHA